jgi:ribose transport system substrate-binding protein
MFTSTTRQRRVRVLTAAAGVVAAAALSLTACSSGAGSSSSSGGVKHIVMIPGVSGNEGYDSVVCGAKEIASKNKDKVKLTVQAANTFDPAAQTPILQAAIATHPDAILIAPTDATAMIAPIQQAIAAGIKVILFDSNLASPSGTSAWVGVDNAAGGKLAAETMAKLIDEKGKVLVTNFPKGTSTTDARQSGFEDGLKKYPDITYVGAQYSNDPTGTAAQVAAALTKDPDMAGVYATRQDTGEGVVTGVRNAGKLGSVKIVSFDASPSEVEAVKQGNVQALVAQDVHDEGTVSMNVAMDVLAGKTVKATNTVGFFAITQDNVNTQDAKDHYYTADCKY